jgi:hypothetical protein
MPVTFDSIKRIFFKRDWDKSPPPPLTPFRSLFRLVTGYDPSNSDRYKLGGFFIKIITIYTPPFALLRFAPKSISASDSLEVILACAYIVGGGYLAWFSFKCPSAGRIVRVLRAYIFGAIMFSGLYFISYNHDKSLFSFSSGIIGRADLLRLGAIDDDIKKHNRMSLAEATFLDWIDSMPDKNFSIFMPNRTKRAWAIGEKTRVRFLTDDKSYGIEFADSEGRISTQGEEFVGEWPLRGEHTPQYMVVAGEGLSKRDYQRSILRLKDQNNVETRYLEYQLANIDQRAFCLFDFVYLSFETVTTLGYGDMVPNATWIRLLIVGQILFGFSLVLMASQETPKSPEKITHDTSGSEA